MQTVRIYDHRVHAGNAGDVWKHFVLAEAAGYLLSRSGDLIYAESHVGRREYLLDSRGEWTGGVGRCWRHLHSLQNFCYFRVLARLNPHGPRCYPGSARLVLEVSKMRDARLHAQVWDVDSDVAAAWTARQDMDDVEFHQGDGFAGVLSLLDRFPPGLLLVDPPYVDPEDVMLAEDLLCRASEKGWIVLWWYMAGEETVPQGVSQGVSQEVSQGIPQVNVQDRLSLDFVDAGMDCGRWQSATVALAGANELLVEHLKRQAAALQEVLKGA